MTRVRRIMMLILAIFFCVTYVAAQDVVQSQSEILNTDSLEDGLQGSAEEYMEEFDPTEQADIFQGVLSVFKKAAVQSTHELKAALSTMLRVLLIVILCQIADAACDEHGKSVATMTGALAIVASCAAGIHAMVGLGRTTINEISGFSSLLMPVMVSAATASGSFTGAGVIYSLTSAFSALLVRLCNTVLVPAVYAYLALAMIDNVLQQERLKRLRELVGWCIEKGLRAIVYLYTGFLAITGALSGTADATALKAAKMTISGVVPVVGGIISGAAETVLSSATYLKNAIGTFGMLAIFSIFILPFLNMGISYILFKVSAALGGILESKHSSLLEAISTVMGYLLAMTASCALITFLSCCCFIRTVTI